MMMQTPIQQISAQTNNPYWEIVRTYPGNRIDEEYEHRWSPDCWSREYLRKGTPLTTRDELCKQYTWSIPDPLSLEFVKAHIGPSADLNGAGTGYWSWQLSQMGIDMVAYDLFPPQHTGQNHYHSPRNKRGEALLGIVREVFFDVRAGNHLMAGKHPDRTLLLCWPPYSDDMAAQALQAYLGKRLIYIGEPCGGCTADDDFFALLDEAWEEIAEHRPVQWWGIHDYITVYGRK